MDLTDKDVLAGLALLALYAEDMHRDVQAATDKLTPPIDARLTVEWEVVAFLTAHDAVIPPPGVRLPLNIQSDPVYYGYLAQSRADASSWVVGIRGTSGLAEWIIDGQFLWTDHPRVPEAKVEHGFWNIYNTMALVALDGLLLEADAAKGISDRVGAGVVTVVGHSLGSALATYLTYDLTTHLAERVDGCFFASPRTGDPSWATSFDHAVTRYLVVNYILDVVPHLPTRPAYATLSRALILDPNNADAAVRLDVGCNHAIICYGAMLSIQKILTTTLDPTIDGQSRACVVGDKSLITAEVRSLAAAIAFVASTPLLST